MTEWPTNTDKWIEVDLDAIGHNMEEIKRMLQPGTRLMAVVKANAYGLGAVPVARELIKLGVDLLGVTFLREALQLRYNEIDEDILVFSPLLPEEYLTAIEHNIIVGRFRKGFIPGGKSRGPVGQESAGSYKN